MLHGAGFGEESGARSIVFPCVLPFFSLPQCSGGLKLLWMRLGVRSSGVVWNLWLQTDVDWLRDCCHLLLPCA